MPLTRGERFDRGDFEARDKVLQARADADKSAAVAERLAANSEAAATSEPGPPGAPPANPEESAARTHLAELGYSASEIDQLIAGPKAG